MSGCLVLVSRSASLVPSHGGESLALPVESYFSAVMSVQCSLPPSLQESGANPFETDSTNKRERPARRTDADARTGIVKKRQAR